VAHPTPTLHHQVKALPWRKVPVADHTHTAATVGSSSAACRSPPSRAWTFPPATQALRITRRVRPLGSRRWRACGAGNIAAALRRNARDATRPLALLGITSR
jgi:hypothetical protein